MAQWIITKDGERLLIPAFWGVEKTCTGCGGPLRDVSGQERHKECEMTDLETMKDMLSRAGVQYEERPIASTDLKTSGVTLTVLGNVAIEIEFNRDGSLAQIDGYC